MKDKLADALNEIQDDYIEKAAKAGRKRHLRWLGAVAAVLAVVILLNSLVDFWTLEARAISQADYDSHSRVNWETAKELSDTLQGFFTDSLAQILGDAAGENKTYSPINLYMALAVTAELSGGNDQLLALMDADNLEALRLQANQVWNACYRDSGDQTLLANSIWLQKGIDYDQTLLDLLAENYFTSSYAADFGTAGTNNAIATWLDQQTGDLLKKQTAKIDVPANTLFALYSTVYYRAKWSEEFSSALNTKGIFHGTQDTTCTFMNKKETFGMYYWGADFSAVTLSLKDGSHMWLILPDEDKTADDVLAAGEYMAAILGQTENSKYMKINLSLPKFDINSSGDLKQDLCEMGVTEIFDEEAGCFAEFLKSSQPVWIDAVNQATRVKIDEEGVTAASYIEFPGATSAMPPEEIIDFILDRPFLFVITNNYDLPLFAGVVNDLR